MGCAAVQFPLVCPRPGADRLRRQQPELHQSAADTDRRPNIVGAGNGHQRRLLGPEPGCPLYGRHRHQHHHVHAGARDLCRPDRDLLLVRYGADHHRHRPDARDRRRAADGNADDHRFQPSGDALGLHDALQSRRVHAAVADPGDHRRHHLAAVALDGRHDLASDQLGVLRNDGARHVQDHQLLQRLRTGGRARRRSAARSAISR